MSAMPRTAEHVHVVHIIRSQQSNLGSTVNRNNIMKNGPLSHESNVSSLKVTPHLSVACFKLVHYMYLYVCVYVHIDRQCAQLCM